MQGVKNDTTNIGLDFCIYVYIVFVFISLKQIVHWKEWSGLQGVKNDTTNIGLEADKLQTSKPMRALSYPCTHFNYFLPASERGEEKKRVNMRYKRYKERYKRVRKGIVVGLQKVKNGTTSIAQCVKQ